jgi:predicted acyl esterase
VLIVHGWHDLGMPGNPILSLLEGLTVPWHFVIGGGGHDGQDDASALSRRTSLVDGWLDFHLLGVGSAPAPRQVTWVTRPGWEEHSAASFGPVRWEALHLRHGGTLTSSPAEGAVANLNITHVPRDPSYDLSRALHCDLAGTLDAWPREQVAFDGPPLQDALELRGAPRFVLHVLPERPWLQVHAELWDVSPDGTATRISRGHFGTRAATPGQHLQVEIEARLVAWRVEAGHHLRVVVADQDHQHVVPEYRLYRARLFVDAERPSVVVLPVG